VAEDPGKAIGPWEVHVIEYARSRNQPVASLVHGAFADGAIDLPFGFVLARAPGRTILVDTGFMMEGHGAEMAVRFDIPYWTSPVAQLAALGVAPGDVTDIVLSHAHFDHMGSIDKFPNARIFIQKREFLSWVEALALPPRFGFLTAAIDLDDMLTALAATSGHRLTLIDGDQDDLLPGVHVRLAEGHTLGQQFVALDTARGRFVVTGDCIYSSRNLTGEKGDGVYIPLGFGVGSIWEQLKSFDRMERFVGGDIGRLIILHDFDRWKRFEPVLEHEGFGIWKVA
jgi:glyoxylase-like metal-dependent hydrolase (beta-lactamase superfamily II)